MSDNKYDLIFRGDIVLGQHVGDVKQRLQALFKIDPNKVDQLFCGRPVALKRQVDEASAKKYCEVLKQAGALVSMVSVETEQPRRANVLTLRELRGQLVDANEIARPEPVRVAIPDYGIAAVGSDVLMPHERVAPVVASIDMPVWHVAAPGADVLTPDERPRVAAAQVTVPSLDVAPAGSDLVDAIPAAAAAVPDISHLSVVDLR